MNDTTQKIAAEAWKQITDYADNCEDAIGDLTGDTNCIRFIQSAIEKATKWQAGQIVALENQVMELRRFKELQLVMDSERLSRAAQAGEQQGADFRKCTEGLQYIIDSPEQKHGGFHPNAVRTAKLALKFLSATQTRARPEGKMKGKDTDQIAAEAADEMCERMGWLKRGEIWDNIFNTFKSAVDKAVDQRNDYWQKIAKSHGCESVTDAFVELTKLRAAQFCRKCGYQTDGIVCTHCGEPSRAAEAGEDTRRLERLLTAVHATRWPTLSDMEYLYKVAAEIEGERMAQRVMDESHAARASEPDLSSGRRHKKPIVEGGASVVAASGTATTAQTLLGSKQCPAPENELGDSSGVAAADADFVLRWLKQCNNLGVYRIPDNIIGLQERVCESSRAAHASENKRPKFPNF